MHSDSRSVSMREWRTIALGVCATWLVVQNLLLAMVVLAWHPTGVMSAGVALARSAWHIAGPAWAFGMTLLLAAACMMGAVIVYGLRRQRKEGCSHVH